jgi:hypothetical protein
MAGKASQKAPLVFTTEVVRWCNRIEKEHRVLTRVSFRTTPRLGILDVYIEVWTMVDEKPYTRLVRHGFDYPNSGKADFQTQILGLLAATEARLEEALKVWAAQANMLSAGLKRKDTKTS